MSPEQPKLESANGKVSLLALVRRKEGTTREEFSKWWYEVHVPMVAAFNEKNGLINYSQVCSQGRIPVVLDQIDIDGPYRI